jgi:hypothetical protein
MREHTMKRRACQPQLLSLISEGLFDQLPTLRVVLIKSRCTWLPSLMWASILKLPTAGC